MEPFRPFTLLHALALAGIATFACLLILLGHRARTPRPGTLERNLAFANLACWIGVHGWWLLPPRFDPATTLPLQLCHITSLVASGVLLTRHHALRVLLYFWTFGLSTQALLTPSLTDPPSSVWFWAFWFQHGFIFAVASHDLAVHRYRPTWGDYRLACAASAAYVAFVLPVNIAFAANYGFVGDSKPGNPSIVDLLGSWPQRLLIIVALVAAVLALLVLPWQRRRSGRPAPP